MEKQIKSEYIILFLLFLFVLAFRLYFAFNTNHFNTDGAYLNLRHIEHLVQDKQIMSYDSLSYGGRAVLYAPLFDIILALLSFGSLFLLKLIPEIFISLTIIIVYLIAKEISGNGYAAIFSAALSAFFPILFSETLNNLSIYSLVIPILLLMLYSLLKLDDKKYLWIFILCSFSLPLIHPSAFLYVVSVFAYFILLAGGAIGPTKLKKEAVMFSFLLIILFEFIIYKKAFLIYGANILWQNVPANILSDSFRNVSPLDLIIGVGLLPLILGIIGIYIVFAKEKKKAAFMFSAFALAILVMITLRFLTISVGLMFLGLVLSIFSASTIVLIYNYLSNFKFNYLKNFFVIILLILFLISSFLPSFYAATKSNDVASLIFKEVKWLELNTANDSVVLGNINEGNLIATVGKRKNVIDTDFILAPDPIKRANDVDTIYKTPSEAIALKLIKEYNISVIYFSYETRDIYGVDNLKYVDDSSCFKNLKDGAYYVIQC